MENKQILEDKLQEEKELSAIPVNPSSLSTIPYERDELQDIIEELPIASDINTKLLEYLNNIERQVAVIHRYQKKKNPKDFYGAMEEALKEIRNTANAIYELTKLYHPTFPNALKQKILNWIAPLEKSLNTQKMPLDDRVELELKTKKLYAEQSFLVRKSIIHKSLREHLAKVSQLLSLSNKPFPRCYISYAWPSKENKEAEYWVQPFLLVLYEHLKKAGIQAIIDIQDTNPGDSIYQFMQQYHEGNYVILIGTESLLQKHYSHTAHAVKTELSIISDRFEQDYKQYGQSRIYPLLISGTLKSSYPEIYDKYRTVRDGREVSYLGTLKRLIDWIYEARINQSKLKYEELWQSFYKDLPELPNSLEAVEQELRFGYHRQRLEYLKEDVQYQSVQAQEEAKYSPAVSAKMIGILMESTGNSPKTLFDEHGIQFQRPYSNPDFIERPGLWDKMTTHFAQREQQILTLTAHGLGGVGKTELASYYYLHPPRPYTLRAWFNASSKETIYSQYVELGEINGIKFTDDMPIEQKALRVKGWLEGQKDCLLVYDNVPDLKAVEELLPKDGKHHILMTSRNEVDWPQHQKLDVDVMEEFEAIALIRKITGIQGNNEWIKKLVNDLGRLPLALAQAGAYISVKALNIEEYLNLYQSYQVKLLSDETVRAPKHEPVWITFNMNFEALARECPEALITLKQASWLSHTAIPAVLLKPLLISSSEPTELLWGEIKEQLRKYSLIRINTQIQIFSIHPLLQEILRAKQEINERNNLLQLISGTVNKEFQCEKIALEDEKRQRILFPHLIVLVQHYNNIEGKNELNNFEEFSNLLFNLGRSYFYYRGELKTAKVYFNRALLYQRSLSDNKNVAITLAEIGNTCNNLGEPSEGEIACKEALVIQDNLNKEDYHSLVVRSKTLTYLADAYSSQGHYVEAKELYEKTLEIRKKIYPEDHQEIGSAFSNLAANAHDIADYEKVCSYSEAALKILEKHYGANHLAVANALVYMGYYYRHIGNFEKAKEVFEKILEILKSCYEGEHLDISITLKNLGCCYRDLEDNKLAKECFEKALKIRSTIQPERYLKQPQTAYILTNLGSIHKDLGDFEQAKEDCEKAVSILRPTNIRPNFALALTNLASVYNALGDSKAISCCEEALSIQESLSKEEREPPLLAYTLFTFGDILLNINLFNKMNGFVYQDLEKLEKAKKYYEEALKIREEHYGKNHFKIVEILLKLGFVYRSLGKNEEAKQYCERALKIQENHYGKEHVRIAHILDNLGNACGALGNLTEAKESLERALNIKEQYYGKEHVETAITFYNLGIAYAQPNENNKAALFYQKAYEIFFTHYGVEHPCTKQAFQNLQRLKVIHQEAKKPIIFGEERINNPSSSFLSTEEPNPLLIFSNTLPSVDNTTPASEIFLANNIPKNKQS